MSAVSASRPRRRTNVMIPDHVFGALVFVFVEMMFYSALLSSFFVMRRGRDSWGQEDFRLLPVVPEGFNGLVLLLSFASIFLGLQTLSRDTAATRRHLLRALALTLLFSAYQLVLGWKLVGSGVTLTSSVFGGCFFLLFGSHLLQAVLGTAWLARLVTGNRLARASEQSGLRGLAVLWGFLAAVWVAMYVALFF